METVQTNADPDYFASVRAIWEESDKRRAEWEEKYELLRGGTLRGDVQHNRP